MPTVLVAIVAAFALASVTVVASVGAQRGTVRDQNSKAALAAAEAGVSEALLHYNRYPTDQCLVGTPMAIQAPSGDWCAPVSRNIVGVPGASFTYHVRPTTVGELEIVSTGNADGVTRRVDVVARSSGGLQPFRDASVIGLNSITMNSNATITANLATNGDITMDSNAVVNCDYGQVGIGHGVVGSGASQFSCPPVEGTISLPPVNQGDVVTNNSNGNFFAKDTYSSKAPSWNPATRVLSMGSNTKLTLTGSNYSFCRLVMSSNAELIIAAGATVVIYFDSPEACGLTSASSRVQLDMSSNTRITPTGADAGQIALLFVGSESRTTWVELNSNTQVPDESCEQDFVLYAPRTEILMNSNSTFCGGVAGKSITMDSNADINTNDLASDFELPNTLAPHYAPEDFIECSATAAGTPPDSGC